MTVSQTMWCVDVNAVLTCKGDRLEAMKNFEQKSFKNLNNLAALVRGELPKLTRNILCALITIDVHARDIISGMVEKQVFTVFNAILTIVIICTFYLAFVYFSHLD